MKKTMLLIALTVSPMISYAQSIFDKLEDMEGVSSVVVSKDAFEILSKFNPESLEDNETMEVFSMINNLNELKVFSTDQPSIANEMEALVKSAIKKFKLTELMRIKEDDSRVKIYVKSGNSKEFVSEVLMFVKGINKKTKDNVDSMIISLTGTIDINKISKLADTYSKDSSKN